MDNGQLKMVMSTITNGQIYQYFHVYNIKKNVELVSNLHDWTKNIFEMFLIQDPSNWSNSILIVLRIQKN